MLDNWTRGAETPMDRLRCFAEMWILNRQEIQRYGCPVGTLCAELAKLKHSAEGGAGMIFGQFKGCLRLQFEALGRTDDADRLVMRLLSRGQGVSALASAFHDEAFVRHEASRIEPWLVSLGPAQTSSSRKRPNASQWTAAASPLSSSSFDSGTTEPKRANGWQDINAGSMKALQRAASCSPVRWMAAGWRRAGNRP